MLNFTFGSKKHHFLTFSAIVSQKEMLEISPHPRDQCSKPRVVGLYFTQFYRDYHKLTMIPSFSPSNMTHGS